jgi:hypothetical protein
MQSPWDFALVFSALTQRPPAIAGICGAIAINCTLPGAGFITYQQTLSNCSMKNKNLRKAILCCSALALAGFGIISSPGLAGPSLAPLALQDPPHEDCVGHSSQDDLGNWRPLSCRTADCNDPCSAGMETLSPGHELWWCECQDSGEPVCCHTQQRRIDGLWQEPEGYGPCYSTNGGCPTGGCNGSPEEGFYCHDI